MYLEIRSGEGGDDAKAFASELQQTLETFARKNNIDLH